MLCSWNVSTRVNLVQYSDYCTPTNVCWMYILRIQQLYHFISLTIFIIFTNNHMQNKLFKDKIFIVCMLSTETVKFTSLGN